jgi:hypothetical protein
MFQSTKELWSNNSGRLYDFDDSIEVLGAKLANLVGGLEQFLFFHILGIVTPTD